MQRRSRRSGFSLVELLVVLGITIVVAALAIPAITEAVNDWKLRSTTSDLAGFLQRARIKAIQTNGTVAVCPTTFGSGGGATTGYYLDANCTAGYDTTKPVIVLPGNMQHLTTVGSALGQSQLGFSPQNPTAVPSFNSRGLPCVVDSNVCKNFTSSGTPIGFVYYVQDTRMLGTSGRAAVSVSPAGRVKAWTWNSKTSTWQ